MVIIVIPMIGIVIGLFLAIFQATKRQWRQMAISLCWCVFCFLVIFWIARSWGNAIREMRRQADQNTTTTLPH
jgi:hypothetical protein